MKLSLPPPYLFGICTCLAISCMKSDGTGPDWARESALAEQAGAVQRSAALTDRGRYVAQTYLRLNPANDADLHRDGNASGDVHGNLPALPETAFTRGAGGAGERSLGANGNATAGIGTTVQDLAQAEWFPSSFSPATSPMPDEDTHDRGQDIEWQRLSLTRFSSRF